MQTREAARRWADTWRTNWVAQRHEPIAALYAPNARYGTAPFREPYIGPSGALEYLAPVFAEESDVAAWFGEPIVDGRRASIQWWASLLEQGAEVTYAGTSIVQFDEDGLVVEEWDSWNRTDGRLAPSATWGRELR
jgi:hypothetical protein